MWSWDIGRQRVFIKHNGVRLHDVRGKPLFSKVTASETVHIPPGQEMIIPGKVCSKRGSEGGMATLEPATCISKNTGALIARVVVD